MKTPDPPRYAGSVPRNRSLRLFFEYDQTGVRLVSVQRLEMIAPPPQAAVAPQNQRGSWLELHDGEGRPLYRRVIDNPLRHDLEVVVDDPRRPLQRVRAAEPGGAFFLVVPDLPLARTLVLTTEPPPQRTRARTRPAPLPPLQVNRFELTQEGR
jgi:hypothetical protein